MNTQLIIPDEIKRELSVNPDGTCVISIRGLARLLEINHQSLLYHFNSGKKSPTKLAETLINQGFNMVKFSDDGIPEIAISTIIVYYSSHGNKNVKQRATDILLAYSAIGIRTWIQHELGYNQSTNNLIINTCGTVFNQVLNHSLYKASKTLYQNIQTLR